MAGLKVADCLSRSSRLWPDMPIDRVSQPSDLSGFGVPLGVELALSTRVCLDPERGVTLLLRKAGTGDTSSSLWWVLLLGAASPLLGVESGLAVRLGSGVARVTVWCVGGRVREATLGVRGARATLLARVGFLVELASLSNGIVGGAGAALRFRIGAANSRVVIGATFLSRGPRGARSDGAVVRDVVTLLLPAARRLTGARVRIAAAGFRFTFVSREAVAVLTLDWRDAGRDGVELVERIVELRACFLPRRGAGFYWPPLPGPDIAV